MYVMLFSIIICKCSDSRRRF